MSYLPSLGAGASVPDLYKRFPRGAKALTRHHEAVMVADSALSRAERELIAAFVSGLNGCDYCYGVHSKVTEELGTDEGLAAKLVADLDSAPVDENWKALLRYVARVTLDQASLKEADARAVLAAGWSERAFHDAMMVTAAFNYMNRIVEGMGIEGDEDYFAMAGKRIAESGYASLLPLIPDPDDG